MPLDPLSRPTRDARSSRGVLAPRERGGTSPGHELALDEVTTLAGLEALGGEWAALWLRDGRATPFQHPAWLIAWWRHFAPTAGVLRALTARRHGRLVGVCPLFLHARSDGARELMLLGTGNSDHLGPVLHPGHAAGVVAAVGERLASRRHEWDACSLQQLAPESPLLALRVAGAPEPRVEPGEPCPVLDTEAGVGLPDAVPPRLRDQLRYYERRARREGLAFVDAATPDDVARLLDALVRLHAARWRARNEPGVLADPVVQRFHRDAAGALLAAGLLRLSALAEGERLAAVCYALADGRCTYYYLGGFDPALERLSPGTLLIGREIENTGRRGARRFDFLRGRETYKYRWGATDRPTRRVVIAAS